MSDESLDGDLGNQDEAGNGQGTGRGLAAKIGVAAGVLILIVVGAIAFFNQGGDSPTVTASPSPGLTRQETIAPTPSQAAPTPTPTPTPAATPTPTPTPSSDQCTTATGGFQASTLEIPDLGVTSHVMSVAYDDEGNPGAPPLDDAQGTAWFNGSAEVGSDQGTSMLNIHTYRNGGALGNQLLDELSNGATLELTDGSGNTACYEVYERVKVHVDTVTDAELDRLHADGGDPEAVIVVCDDFNWDEEFWETRVLWYAKKV